MDNDYIVGAVLMDLSKVFDCIPHNLLIAKLSAYVFDENSLDLLRKAGKNVIHVSRLRSFCIEIHKTMKMQNLTFMQDIFHFKSVSNHHHRFNQVTFGINSLRFFAPDVWNILPNEIKSSETVNIL